MNQGDKVVLRTRFKDFLDNESEYSDFIRVCNHKTRKKGRFTYGQEQIWDRFTQANVEYAGLSALDVADAFRICHVHKILLVEVQIPVIKGMWDMSLNRDLELAIVRDAPYSETIAIDTNDGFSYVEVEHCSECLQARKKLEEHSAC
jgi:hypothetical protein